MCLSSKTGCLVLVTRRQGLVFSQGRQVQEYIPWKVPLDFVLMAERAYISTARISYDNYVLGVGLDSFQAQNVMEALWTLAHNGRCVISTIHQPRSSIYSMFDALLLLSEALTVYFGPANQAVCPASTCV